MHSTGSGLLIVPRRACGKATDHLDTSNDMKRRLLKQAQVVMRRDKDEESRYSSILHWCMPNQEGSKRPAWCTKENLDARESDQTEIARRTACHRSVRACQYGHDRLSGAVWL